MLTKIRTRKARQLWVGGRRHRPRAAAGSSGRANGRSARGLWAVSSPRLPEAVESKGGLPGAGVHSSSSVTPELAGVLAGHATGSSGGRPRAWPPLVSDRLQSPQSNRNFFCDSGTQSGATARVRSWEGCCLATACHCPTQTGTRKPAGKPESPPVPARAVGRPCGHSLSLGPAHAVAWTGAAGPAPAGRQAGQAGGQNWRCLTALETAGLHRTAVHPGGALFW